MLKIAGNGFFPVNARDLWEALEVKEPFKNWFNRRVYDYGYRESEDFIKYKVDSKFKRWLTLDMTKELAVIQRTFKGLQIRDYVINHLRQEIDPLKLDREWIESVNAVAWNPENKKHYFIEPVKEKAVNTKFIEFSEKTFNDITENLDIPQEPLHALTIIAKKLKTSAEKLALFLHEKEVVYKCGSKWVPYHNYINNGYCEMVNYKDTEHYHLKWTKKGFDFIEKLWNEKHPPTPKVKTKKLFTPELPIFNQKESRNV